MAINPQHLGPNHGSRQVKTPSLRLSDVAASTTTDYVDLIVGDGVPSGGYGRDSGASMLYFRKDASTSATVVYATANGGTSWSAGMGAGSDFGSGGLKADAIAESTTGAGVIVSGAATASASFAEKVSGTINHATNSYAAESIVGAAVTTARTGGSVDGVKVALTGLAGDTSGATYNAVELVAPTKNGGSAIWSGVKVGAGYTNLLDLSAAGTGEARVSLPTNVAIALREIDATTSKVYRDVVTTTGSEAVNFTQRVTVTDGVSSGTARIVGGRAYVNTAAGTALTASTSETVLGSYTIPANTLGVGSLVRVRYKAKVTANASTTTLTVRLRLGTTTLIGTALIQSGAVDTNVNDVSMGHFELISRAAASASSAIEGMGFYNDPGAAGGSMKHATLDATNFATNGALLLEVTGQWAASDANSCQLEHMSVEIY